MSRKECAAFASDCAGISPGPEAPRIEMDKAGAGIIADPAVSEVQSGTMQLVQRHAGDGDVNSFRLHMQAVFGNLMAFLAEQAVVRRRPVARDDVKFIAAAKFLVDKVEIFDDLDVHVGDFSRIIAAEYPVEGLEGVRIIITCRVPVVDGEPFL